MIILGIESSCDDTSVALLDSSEKGHFVLAEKTASQIAVHATYGGVVPEVAGRMHAETIVPLIEEVLKNQPKPEAIAVTAGPGLVTGLIVGVEAARTLSYALNIPLIAVNHIAGHIHSVEIPSKIQDTDKNIQTDETKAQIVFPALALVVSGNHTELAVMPKQGEYQIIGRTLDDASGECFDKVARMLSLPYPGGPKISALAKNGQTNTVTLPRPMLHQDNFDFSFAGLKTAALYHLRDHPATLADEKLKADFCASFEQAITDVLITKTLKAIKKYSPLCFVLGGGVSANAKLRTTLQTEIQKNHSHISFLIPQSGYSMDNAAMIAVAGYYQATKNEFTKWENIRVFPNWKVNQKYETLG